MDKREIFNIYPWFKKTKQNIALTMAFVNMTTSFNSHLESEGFSIYDRMLVVLSDPREAIAAATSSSAVLLNILTLLAIRKIPRLKAHMYLILSVAVSDLLISLSCVLIIVNRIAHPLCPYGEGPMTIRISCQCTYIVGKALNNTGLNSTLLITILMAVDIYIATFRPMHHSFIVTKKRISIFLAVFWALAFLGGFSGFVTMLSTHLANNIAHCESVYESSYQEEYITFAFALLSFGIMMYAYSKIYWCILTRTFGSECRRIQQARTNRKAVWTTSLIIGTFVVCWLPLCCFEITMIILAKYNRPFVERHFSSIDVAGNYLFNLHLLNTVCDPIIYAIRMPEVQRGLKRLLCCCGNHTSSLPPSRVAYGRNSGLRLTSVTTSTFYSSSLHEA